MNVLLVIPSKIKHGIEDSVANDRHPTMDYFALAEQLRTRGATVDFLDNSAVRNCRIPNDAALAIEAFKVSGKYSSIFTNSESIAIPLALLLRMKRKRPRHVTIAHKLSTGKKALFFRQLKAQREIDLLFVYAETQRNFGVHSLGINSDQISLISFHADSDFFRPLNGIRKISKQFCSAGLEWRDYPTLIEAARQLPDCTFKIAAASPWSKHVNELQGKDLPPNVSARPYDYDGLRSLYAESIGAIVPLYENDFQAGITTILESMSMGLPVIATRTAGQKDVIIEGATGFYVQPGDTSSLTAVIGRLFADPGAADKVGNNARSWLLEHASLKKWSSVLAEQILDNATHS
jgi:glycosyltransferase involved in cell wall biosynthesis